MAVKGRVYETFYCPFLRKGLTDERTDIFTNRKTIRQINRYINEGERENMQA